MGSDNLQKGSILWVILWRGFNSLSHQVKEVQFFESNFWKSSSIFWVTFHKKSSILWVVFKKMFNSLDHKSVQLSLQKMGSILCVMKKKKVQFFWVTKRAYWKKVQFFESNWKKSSIHWVIFHTKFKFLSHSEKKEWFNSLSRIQNVQLFQSCSKKCSILWIIWEKTIFWVKSNKKNNPLGRIFKKFNYKSQSKQNNTILRVTIKK